MTKKENTFIEIYKYFAFTCLTLQVCITGCTLTQVTVDLIYTGTAVLAGCTGTLVYI